jgi:selenocysteine-specific elongation factor
VIQPRAYIVGTAGHIDHGKTSLVRALTGVDTDRLPEEKERGITIDLGFAGYDLASGVHLGFVDVPGHERFVKNMLAGVGGIDLMLLVVAADESIMPQTREHFDICTLLGVRRGLVALTKIDLVAPDLRDLAELEVREYLDRSPLAVAEVVRVSSRTGEGLDRLRSALAAAVHDLPPREASGPVRLPVDRVFSARGFGTVVTGTLASGMIATGDDLVLYPALRATRARRIEVHGRETAEGRAGERVALNLQGIEAGDVSRGDVVGSPGAFRPSSLIDVRLRLLPSCPAALRDLARVRFHLGTGEALARVRLLSTSPLPAGGEALAQLRLETPQVSLPGDRFILRRYSPATTIGGGVVLDPLPEKHRGAVLPAAARLGQMASSDLAERLVLIAERAGLAGARLEDLRVRCAGSLAQLTASLADAVARRRLEVLGSGERAIYVGAETLARARTALVERLERHHAAHPLEPGMGKEALRTELMRKAPVEVYRHALEALEQDGEVVQEADRIRRAQDTVRLSEPDRAESDRLERLFRGAGLDPPAAEGVLRGAGVDAARTEAVFHLLLRQGRLVRLKGGVVFHAEALAELRQRVLNFAKRSETIDIGEFKALSGTTRKNAIPLLEYLDAERVTRREGDRRRILPPSSE